MLLDLNSVFYNFDESKPEYEYKINPDEWSDFLHLDIVKEEMYNAVQEYWNDNNLTEKEKEEIISNFELPSDVFNRSSDYDNYKGKEKDNIDWYLREFMTSGVIDENSDIYKDYMPIFNEIAWDTFFDKAYDEYYN